MYTYILVKSFSKVLSSDANSAQTAFADMHICTQTPAYVSIRQLTSAYVKHTSAYVSIRAFRGYAYIHTAVRQN